jgi:hypothetical protein
VPKRAAFLAAKLGVGAVLVLLASAFAVPLTLLTARAVLGPTAVPVTEPAMLRSAVAAVLYVTLLTVLCMNIAMLIRNQAGAIGLLVPFFFLLSPLLELVPVVQEAAAFLPDRAGATALRLESRPTDPFGPLTAMGSSSVGRSPPASALGRLCASATREPQDPGRRRRSWVGVTRTGWVRPSKRSSRGRVPPVFQPAVGG